MALLTNTMKRLRTLGWAAVLMGTDNVDPALGILAEERLERTRANRPTVEATVSVTDQALTKRATYGWSASKVSPPESGE